MASEAIHRVFITGASSGLGRGMALHYAREGAHVGLVARRAELLAELAKELGERGARPETYAGDVSDTAFMKDCAERFTAAAGGIDLVLANAGVNIRNGTREGESGEIAWLLGVNAIGVTNTVVPFVPAMLAQGSGVLCAVSSVAGHRALPGRAAYSASKKCVTTFMEGLRQDLHGTGVHAMTLCPGFVDTPLTKDNPGMMFLISCDQAVREMSVAISARKTEFTFPWQFRLLAPLMKWGPEALIRRLAPPPRTRSMT